MSKLQSHFYIVKGTPKDNIFPTVGWLFHSYKELEDKGHLFGYGECGDFMYMPIEWFSEE